MSHLTLFHGSDHIIEKPQMSLCREHNDYGKGFYCTESEELAGEWACLENRNGYINRYKLNTEGLKVLNLLDGAYTNFKWMALLLQNRIFTLDSGIAPEARSYLIRHFTIDLKEYDIVIGYRADNSYFSYVQSFVSNTLSLETLNDALYLGNLGAQTVLISQKAFDQVQFESALPVQKDSYYPSFLKRETFAREHYKEKPEEQRDAYMEVFVMEFLMKEIMNDVSCIQ